MPGAPGIDASVVIKLPGNGPHLRLRCPEKFCGCWMTPGPAAENPILEAWCKTHGVEVAGRQLKVNWRYDVMGLLETLKENGA